MRSARPEVAHCPAPYWFSVLSFLFRKGVAKCENGSADVLRAARGRTSSHTVLETVDGVTVGEQTSDGVTVVPSP